MTDNMTLVQEIKRYLHESTPDFNNSIKVVYSDFPCEYQDVVMGLLALEGAGYLKHIGVMGGPEGHLEEKVFDCRDFQKRNRPECSKVVLAKDYGEIDEKFELKWKSADREVWVGKMFIKGFNPSGRAYMDAFAYTYNNSGKTLGRKDFRSVFGTNAEVRLDTVIASALDTLSRNNVKWWYQELGSRKVRCERVYWGLKSEELSFKKLPRHYELDPKERDEWSV